MLKVLIIDDEPIIRKGLKNIINWKQFDCEVCGEAADGLQGRELIKVSAPDIIITDIRMPEMDGLSMIKQIKEAVPDSKIIILTGYRDFDYVQDALKLGAFDFLLKPTKIEEFTSVIGRAAKELKFQRARSEELDKLKRLFEQNIPVLREKLLYDVIYEINTSEEDITANLELFGLKVENFVLVVLEKDSEEGGDKSISQYERHLYQFGIVNTFEEVFSDLFRVTNIALNEKWTGFIIQLKNPGGKLQEIINKKCAYLQDIIVNCFGFTITIAVSSEGRGPMQLPSRLRECREALEHKFYLGGNSIILHCDLQPFFKYQDYSALDKYREVLLEGIKSGNEKLVRSKLSDITGYITNLGPEDSEYVKNYYWNAISTINGIRLSVASADGGRKNEPRNMTGLFRMIERCDDVKELDELLREIALSVASKVNNFNNRSMKLVLKKAVEFIKEHFSEQVTLNEVAAHTFVSTYYISRMFKKETGKNFVDFLNEIRLEKAKELLKDVRLKTYEIAEIVGIPDAHYFSRLFKKYEGCTPSEFREMIE